MGAVLAWSINVSDLGLLRPLQWNLWRELAGIAPLPLDYWALLKREIGAFHRWWLVVGIAIGATVYVCLEIRRNWKSWRMRIAIPGAAAWILAVGIFELYYLPTNGQQFCDWVTRLLISLVFSLSLVGLLACVRLTIHRFLEE
jgi:hypothetical protein